jgi:hypothetical protein
MKFRNFNEINAKWALTSKISRPTSYKVTYLIHLIGPWPCQGQMKKKVFKFQIKIETKRQLKSLRSNPINSKKEQIGYKPMIHFFQIVIHFFEIITYSNGKYLFVSKLNLFLFYDTLTFIGLSSGSFCCKSKSSIVVDR